VAEILARAKKAPLHWEARATLWDDVRFSAFEKELLPRRVSHICHLSISTEAFFAGHLKDSLHEYLSLSWTRVFVPDTLFGDGTTPIRLSCLELRHRDISWKSPLLQGVRYLDLRSPFENSRPSLTDWFDAIVDEMPQLGEDSASPIAPPFSFFNVRPIVTLPFLKTLGYLRLCGGCVRSHLLISSY
jgi:hypothetical protein